MRNFLFAGLVVAALLPRVADAADGATASVTGGTIAGVEANDVIVFKGIPYAAPPLGDLRWRAPQPVTPWSGTRSAAEFGNDCMQTPVADEAAPLGTAPSENCLFVNVWRPATDAPAGGYAVMVWIHGGGFLNGGASAPIYDGAALARRGIVVVSLNYRLGRLGFFAHPALLAAQPTEAGNFGLMDQIAALQWVQANIAALGGDPGKVTIVGESAGGASVLALLTSPKTAGLFRGAMIMSGGGRQTLISRPMTGGMPEVPASEDGDAAYARTLGIEGNGADALAKLRALPAEALVKDWTLPAMLGAVLGGKPLYDGIPMIDGDTIIDTPQKTFAAGKEQHVPVIVGTTAQDVPVIFPPRTDPLSWFGPDRAAAKTVFDPDDTVPDFPLALTIASDISMHEPARFVARSVTANGEPAWLYRYTYAAQSLPKRLLGASHSQEVPFLFDNVDTRYGNETNDKDREAARQFSGYVVNFVKTGDPNGGGLPNWPKFDAAQFDLMNFTLDDGPVFGADPRAGRIRLVEAAADRPAQ
ncbi:MAG TPA: carboxylesterase family protein [Bauldia sp.]|nr:carboxylesterase family protein [Bauldia sp.]